MAKHSEFEGKDLEEALHAAAAALGVEEPELDYKIIEQGRRGLFGVGAKSVRIRVMPPLGQPADPLAATQLRVPTDGTERTERRERRPRRQRPRREKSRERPPRELAEEKPRSKERAPTRVAPEAEEVAQTLGRMLTLMGMELSARPTASENGVAVEVDGPDAKLLTQKDGELLTSLQFLLNRMARRCWPEAGRIHLVCDGHRRQRDEDLVQLTREVAQQVKRTGRTKRLHPMNAYERRLVHITIREFEQLGSRSEGNGHLKRVKIFRQAQASSNA